MVDCWIGARGGAHPRLEKTGRIKEAKSVLIWMTFSLPLPFFLFLFFSFFIVTRPTPRPSSPRQASQRRRHVHACVHAYIVAWRAHTCGVVERAGGTEDNSNDCTNPLVSTLYKSRARTVLGNNGPQRV